MNCFTEFDLGNKSFKSHVLSYGRIWVDTDSCQVTYDGIVVPLLPKEYKLLLLFIKYPNHVLSYEFIIDKIWNMDKCPTFSSIRTHIKGIRKAFKKAHYSEDIIENVHGMGYRLKLVEKEQSTNPVISPSLSVMKGLLKYKAIEYVVIDDQFIIKFISPGLSNYCDYPELLKVGIKAQEAFSEFVGLEEIFEEVINQKINNFEIK